MKNDNNLGGMSSDRSEARTSVLAALDGIHNTIRQNRWVSAVALTLIGVLSLFLLLYGFWLLQLERGAGAVAHGEIDKASALYASAERPFQFGLARLFPEQYSRAVFPKIALLYNSGKINDAVKELERATTRSPSLAERPEFELWSGNILLRRALEATDPENILKHLYAASGHYRKALEASPQDWDVKYNYELAQHLIAEQEREKEKELSKMKSILERVRTITEPAPKEPPPPEKQG